MLARQLISSNLRSTTCGTLRKASMNTSSGSSRNEDEEQSERAVRKLKNWRKPMEPEDGVLKMLQPNQPKGREFKVLRAPLRLTPIEIKQWFQSKKVNYAKFDQRFVNERHETLGCDLAAAHFLVHRNGKVKFLGQDEWIQKQEDGTYSKLPTKYDPYWQLTHIDASGIPLYYEGLSNFINLGQAKWASFKGNPHFDDWCMDKIMAHLPKLEYLDVSECRKLTERGLSAIYRLYNLKTLIVTDWDKVPSFELTCIMLEDLNRDLKIEIKEPENADSKGGK